MNANLPISKKPSNGLVIFTSVSRVELNLTSGFPGWITVTSTIPRTTFITEVITKYVIVRTAIFPFLPIFNVAVPIKE